MNEHANPSSATEHQLGAMTVREPNEISKAQRIDWVYDTEGVTDELLGL